MAEKKNLKSLVTSLDDMDLSDLTVGDLKSLKNPVLASTLRKMLDAELAAPSDTLAHTSHSNHQSHYNHLSHYSSMMEAPQDNFPGQG